MKWTHRFLSACLSAVLVCHLAAPALAEGQTVHASLRSPLVLVNGIDVGFLDDERGIREPVTYGSMVYIPLATVGLWMGADTRWDADAKTVTITSSGAEPVYYSGGDFNPDRLDLKRPEGVEQYQQDMKNGVDVVLCPDVTVTVDGQVKVFASDDGAPLCPLLFRACVYLPVSGVAELLGLNALWLERWNTVNLYDPEALEAAGAYTAALRGHLNDARALLEGTCAVGSDQEFVNYMEQLQASIQAIQGLPEPPSMKWYLDAAAFYTRQILSSHIEPYLPLNAVTSPSPATAAFWNKTPEGRWRNIKTKLISMPEKDTTSDFLGLERVCAECEDLLSHAGSGVFFHPGPTAPEAAAPAVQPEAASFDAAQFTDAAGIAHWEAVAALAKLGIMAGKDDGGFHPTDTLTRAEAVKLVALVMTGGREPNLSAHLTPLFSDTHGHWAEGYINFCSTLDLLDGRGDGSFAPEEAVTATQLAKLCLDLLGYDAAACHLTGSAWAFRTDELARAAAPSLYEGLDGVALSRPVSRDDAAQVLYNALQNQVILVAGKSGSSYEYVRGTREDGSPLTMLYQRFGLDRAEIPTQPAKR